MSAFEFSVDVHHFVHHSSFIVSFLSFRFHFIASLTAQHKSAQITQPILGAHTATAPKVKRQDDIWAGNGFPFELSMELFQELQKKKKKPNWKSNKLLNLNGKLMLIDDQNHY